MTVFMFSNARVAIKQTQLAEAPHPLAMVLLQRGEQVHQPWRIMSKSGVAPL